MTAGEWAALRGRTLPDVATALIAPLVADTFDCETLGRLMASALSFPIPLVPLVPGIWALELFHGPTLAFKDVGARSMARWLAATAGAAATVRSWCSSPPRATPVARWPMRSTAWPAPASSCCTRAAG